MTVFCDTSVLVAASIRRHPHFERAYPVLESVAAGRATGAMSVHSIAETFSALTSAPLAPRVLPAEARDIVAKNLLRHFHIVPVTPDMYSRALEVCAARGLGGGQVYDALLVECARASNADRIYTFNVSDFRRLAPDLTARIAAP